MKENNQKIKQEDDQQEAKIDLVSAEGSILNFAT